MPSRVLTVYRIRKAIETDPATSFATVLTPEVRDDANLVAYSPIHKKDFEAQLFVHSPDPKVPTWQSFLRQGFHTLHLLPSSSSGAVLVVKREDAYFAFTFGTGRHLLRSDAIERGFGLRVALNLIYAGAPADLERLRQIDAKRVSANTLLSHVQANRAAAFADFGFDVGRDLLGAVAGTPADERWGTRVGGSDALHLRLECELADLGRLCGDLRKAYIRKTYRQLFSWIDKIEVVEEASLRGRLEEKVLASLKGGRQGRFALAPPELVDWDEIAGFRFPFSRDLHDELDIETYLEGLRRAGRLDALDFEELKRHRIVAVDENGQEIYHWPVFRCLDAEVKLTGRRLYVLTGGDFFAVDTRYLSQLNRDIRQLLEWGPPSLPPAIDITQTEEDYNSQVAKTLGLFNLDQKLVSLGNGTTPIEICDLLTRDGSFIHVKRKLASSSLSHLFSQGLVAADLLLMSRPFRSAALEKIRQEAGAGFTPFTEDQLAPQNFAIVYGIIDSWKGRTLIDALPFFSKINLRRCVDDLKRMGYRVFYQRIDVQYAAARKPGKKRASARPSAAQAAMALAR